MEGRQGHRCRWLSQAAAWSTAQRPLAPLALLALVAARPALHKLPDAPMQVRLTHPSMITELHHELGAEGGCSDCHRLQAWGRLSDSPCSIMACFPACSSAILWKADRSGPQPIAQPSYTWLSRSGQHASGRTPRKARRRRRRSAAAAAEPHAWRLGRPLLGPCFKPSTRQRW